jgi:hypothetical protein
MSGICLQFCWENDPSTTDSTVEINRQNKSFTHIKEIRVINLQRSIYKRHSRIFIFYYIVPAKQSKYKIESAANKLQKKQDGTSKSCFLDLHRL